MSRIVVTTGIFPPDIGGPATYIPKFSDFLVAHGHEVKVVTLGKEKTFHHEKYPFALTRINRGKVRWFRVLLSTLQIAKALDSSQYIFSNGLYFETALAMRFKLFKGQSVAKVVGDPVWERKMRRTGGTNKFKNKIQKEIMWRLSEIFERKLFVWTLNQFNRITCPGDELANTVQKWKIKTPVYVVNNGVDIPKKTKENKKIYDLIVISRLVPWKNVDVAISVATSIGCSLVIVGDGPLITQLKMVAGTNPKIVFLGNRTSQEISELLSKSKIFCQFSDYEGLSFSLLQAMAHSLPCVISEIKANTDVFKSDIGAAVFVKPQDLNSTTNQINHLLNTPLVQVELGNRSKTVVEEKYEERASMKKMLDLLVGHD
jgi:glycosyltransferase involved in cell wall biosynthesis